MTTSTPKNFVMYFRDLSKVSGLTAIYSTPEEAIETARWNVKNVEHDTPNQDCVWLIYRIDGDKNVVTIAEYGRKLPIAGQVWGLIKKLDLANRYLENVIEHPEHWHDHHMAIESAKELVFNAAENIADYIAWIL